MHTFSSRRLHILGAILLFSLCVKAQTPQGRFDCLAYTMAGPYAVIARDGQWARTKGGSERDMAVARRCAELACRPGTFIAPYFHTRGLAAAAPSDAPKYRAKALSIINAYADSLRRLDGHDAPLCALQCYDLVLSMIALQADERPEWAAMVRRALLPMMARFEADSPYANGNWGAIVNRLRMACGIFLRERALYAASLDFYLHGRDNASLAHYILPSGQTQETGRDQSHAQLALWVMAGTCALAATQGDDLWGAEDCRLGRALDYAARYNLGHDVPFERMDDLTGLYSAWTRPGAMGRGRLWDIYDGPVRHYAAAGLRLSYAGQAARLCRSLGHDTPRTEPRWVQAPGVAEPKGLHSVRLYDAPDGVPVSTAYDVWAQPLGSEEWMRVAVYPARANARQADGSHRVSETAWAMFDFTGDVRVRVTRRGGRPFRSARVRPSARGVICNMVNDTTVQFRLFQPENVSVEMDSDITSGLLLFTSAPPITAEAARQRARREGRQFVYYPSGLYRIDSLRIPSRTDVYLDGAHFTGTLAVDSAHDVRITGRGVARPESGYEGCRVRHSRGVEIEGLVLNTCPVGQSRGVRLSDVRCMTHKQWGDGLNVFASDSVSYDRVFCRTSDDCTTAYATRKGFTGSTRHIRMTNSTLWADLAHPIFIGLHGNPARPDTIADLVYDNIDILGQAEPQVDYQGCLAINCGDGNTVQRVTFSRIRIEDIAEGSIAQVKVGWNAKYCTAPGALVDSVTFRQVSYTGKPCALSVITGYDSVRAVRHVRFEQLKVNGRLLHDGMDGKPAWYATADLVPMFVGSHVEDLTFGQ